MDRRAMKILATLAALAAVALLAPASGSYGTLLMSKALVFGILAMSVDLLLGYTGLASMGQAAYLGMGAYAAAILSTRYHVGLGCDFALVLAVGAVLGMALAALFGLFAIRTTGVYFLIITLALGMCMWGLAYRWNQLTNGDNGINLLSSPKCVVDFSHDVTFFYLTWCVFALVLGGLYVLVRSPFGRTLVGIKESESRMRMLGYNVWLHKYLAFIIAGGVGGLAGVLWVQLLGIVTPASMVLTTSVDALLVVVLGGPGTLVGSVVGSTVVVLLREYLSTHVPWWQYVLGGAYVLTILFLPGGLMAIPTRMRQARPLATEQQEETGASQGGTPYPGRPANLRAKAN